MNIKVSKGKDLMHILLVKPVTSTLFNGHWVPNTT